MSETKNVFIENVPEEIYWEWREEKVANKHGSWREYFIDKTGCSDMLKSDANKYVIERD